ncbi:MAG: hypothetical protein M0006_13670 [Magnetospirillum sp.]|nr:hypothetical protein [Magnetospirillum sp.]
MAATTEPPRQLGKDELRRTKVGRTEFRHKARHPIKVVLDGVLQNYNIGAIFRLCDAMLVEELVIRGAEVNLRKRKLVQAARGTQLWVPWSQADSAAEVVAKAKADGYQVLIAELADNSVPVDQFVPRFPVCLVLGAEFDGVSPAIADLADAAVEIPMHGMGNSINVATAAAIVLHHLVHHAGAAP